ncbi:MAG: Ig-like domain-containing protein, partial [Methanobacteriota archaeon]
MKISRKMKKVCGLVLSLALISSFIVIGVGGNSGGRFDSAQTGCGNGGCHGPEDPTITVLITGLPLEYTPSQIYALTIDVSGGPATTRGGFNLEVTAGILSSSDVNVRINGAQNQAVQDNEDQRSWSVDWTAPVAGIGDVTFYLAGMACGDPANKDGDSWKLISTIVPEFVPANTPPTVDLTYPDGGQVWSGGFVKKIWWNMSDAEDTDNTQLRVWVNYSVDSGSSWTPIAGAQNTAGTVNPNSYDWIVPTIDTDLARINVTVQDTGGLRTRDTSLADFTIDSTPPTVIVTNPLHGAIDVPRNTNYEVTFSEPMNQNSAENAFELYNTFDWTLVNGVFEPWVGDRMIFNPGGDLAPGMLYSANISSILSRATDDSDPGNEMTFSIFNFFAVDDVPPEVSEVLIDNQPIRTVPAGTIVTLNATINDWLVGFSNVSAANYTIGWQNWASSVPMDPVDGSYDGMLEIVTNTIDTAGWIDGMYNLYVYGSDDEPNHNTTSIEYALLIVSSDYDGPEVSNVMINGAATQTYPLSSMPTLTLTATIDDTATGGSNVTGANYTEGDSNWPGIDMNAADGSFDSLTEDVTIDITPIPTSPRTYYYYVYGWDDKLNYNTTSTAYATLTIVDDLPPEVLNVLADGQTTVTVQPGATVILTATIDDTGTGGSVIGGANNTTGPANWATSVPMNPIAPPLDDPIEDFFQAIDTTGWPMGSYDMYVYGWDDASGSNSTSQAFATIIISADIQKPEIFNVLIDGLQTATVFISSLPPTMTLTATIDDTMAGGSNIAGANYTTPTMTSFPGTDMNAVLPPFDSIIEDVTATIVTPTLAGSYNYYVHAWDEYLNTNNTAPYATLIVVDDVEPQISNVLVDGLTTATYG